MKICTITCHDVYNCGASLQAYGLQTYLKSLGHTVKIIDYKPNYLSQHFRLDAVSNPKYDKPLLRQAYLLAKLPERLRILPRKQAFDRFTASYLDLTRRYHSAAALRADPPEADVYLAGSDQIWNPLFPNGKDPAFYLDFVQHGVRASYAASFAVDAFPEELRTATARYLRRFDHISLREPSGLAILASMGIRDAVYVPDPVFLPERSCWDAMAKTPRPDGAPYLLVYDFDNSPVIRRMAEQIARDRNLRIYSVFEVPYARRCFPLSGPEEFLGLIRNASFVLSNSFHATAFSVIFGKEFAVAERSEQINTRMRDFTAALGLSDRMAVNGNTAYPAIDWADVSHRLRTQVRSAKAYLDEVLRSAGK